MARQSSFSTFMLEPIRIVSQQVHPTRVISDQAAEFVNTKLELFLLHMMELLATSAQIDINAAQAVVQNLLQKTMAEWAFEEANKAKAAYDKTAGDSAEKIAGCGLVFPASEVRKLYADPSKLSDEVAVFVTAVMEYVCADLLQAAGNHAIAMAKDNTISLSDIVSTIAEDEELSKLFFVVSSNAASGTMKRRFKNKESQGWSVLLTPSDKKSTMKLDTKPSTLTPEQLSTIGSKGITTTASNLLGPANAAAVQSDPSARPSAASIAREVAFSPGLDDSSSWDTPSSWEVPATVKSSNALAPVLEGKVVAGSFATMYTGARPLSTSIHIEQLHGSGNFIDKLREAAGSDDVPRSMRERKRLSTSVTETAVPTLTMPEKKEEGEKKLARSTSRAKVLEEGGEIVLIKVHLPDNTITKVEVPRAMLIHELLRYVVSKRALKFEEYSICDVDPATSKPGSVLLDSLTVSSLVVQEVAVVRKDSRTDQTTDQTRTLYVSEGGRDVLVLEMVDDRAQVSAGTIEKLLERLADENRQDNKYVDCMLLTYRFYMEPLQLFEQLYLRFKIQCPPKPTAEEVKYFAEWQKPIQRKVINVMRWWVENYWQDFNNDAVLLDYLLEFYDELRSTNFDNEADQLEASMMTQLQTYRTARPLPTPRESTQSLLLTYDARVVATQLNLWDFELFKSIEPVEYANHVLHRGPNTYSNLEILIKRFDMESFWVATEVCMEPDIRRRVLIVESFIKIGKYCKDTNNFFSTFSIVGGLSLSAVTKLKKTWEEVPSRSIEMLKELETLMSPYQNMKNYRDKMLQSTPPIIPVLPVYLKDLLFTHDGNRTLINKLVNFEKFRMISNLVRQMIALKSIPYPKEKGEPELVAYIKSPLCITDTTKLSRMSADYEKELTDGV